MTRLRPVLGLLVILALFLLPSGAVAQDADVDVDVDAGEVSDSVENDANPTDVESSEDIGADVGEDLSKNTPYEQWQYLLALAIPFVVSVAVRRGMSKEAQTGVMLAVSVVSAVGGSFFRGELDNFQFTATSIMQVVISTQVAYQVLSRTPGVGDLLRGLEASTGGDDAATAKARKMQPTRPPG
jgi:hypothetical protein